MADGLDYFGTRRMIGAQPVPDAVPVAPKKRPPRLGRPTQGASMKLYEFAAAPNPRRVRMFMAEKGMTIPTEQVNLRGGEQFSDRYKAINPQCVVPYLELDDGSGIGEVVAICRYLEEIHPDNPLLGTDPKSKALIAMWDHRVEAEGLSAVAEAFRNTVPAFKGRALSGPHDFEQIPELADRGKARLQAFFRDLDHRLGQSDYVAGPSFSIADISAVVAVDFAGWLKITIPDELTNLKRWYAAVSARPSAKA